MSDLEKNEMSIEEEMEQAKSFYKTLTDPTYLLGVDVETGTYRYIFDKCVFSSLNMKDVEVLASLLWTRLDWETQTFSFKYDDFTNLASKSNLSKNMKKLVDIGFLDKIKSDKSKAQRYFFRAQYNYMKSVI